MPTPRMSFATAICNDKIYVIGGQNSMNMITTPVMNYQFEILTGANEVYAPTTDTWATKTPMPTPRNFLQANVVDGKIYLIGGQHQQPIELPPTEHSSNLTEVYDPENDSWSTMASIPNTVYGYSSAVVDGKIYIISGWTNKGTLSDQVQIFDPKTNAWSLGAPIPHPVREAAAAATSGVTAPKRIYVVGGSEEATRKGGEHGTNLTQVYDPEADSWSRGADMPTERWGLAIAVTNDLLYALGGASISLSNINEQYTPIGYGTVTPSPSTTVTPSPELTPTQSPTASTAASEQPSQKPGDSDISSFSVWLVVAVAVAIAAAIVVSAFALRRRGLCLN
jgi:N-acetylneuraminic acid mutarotase